MDDQVREHIRQLRKRELDERGGLSPITATGDVFRRTGELLVSTDVEESLRDRMSGMQGRPYDEADTTNWRNQIGLPDESTGLPERLDHIGLRLWWFPDDKVVSDALHDLRGYAGRRDAVHYNHVLFGEDVVHPYPIYQGGPGDEPVPAPRPDLATADLPAGQVDVAVLDTGLPEQWQTWHPNLNAEWNPSQVNVLYGDQPGLLAAEAGHGLFICGLVHRLYPDVAIEAGKVLDPGGTGDDGTVGARMAQTAAPVISLSLGTYTDDDQPPPGIAAALARLGPDRVVVAAAGNNASGRLFWPAACDGVIAVAAYDSVADRPADFSNHGPWVQLCAPGCHLHSTYVDGTWPAHDGDRRFHLGATWSGTSFAAPLVAAEIARRARAMSVTAAEAARRLLDELPDSGWDGFGRRYTPPIALTLPTS